MPGHGLRVIAGRLRGRGFASPRGSRTRPMSEKVRGALFNALGDIEGLSVLDAFAGSGALAFEALSRGAAHAVAIDSDRSAQKAIDANINLLGLSTRAKLIAAGASAWLATAAGQSFDIVICDPPYSDIRPELLQRLAERAAPGGTVILSLPPTSDFKLETRFTLLAQKKYGDAMLCFYRHSTP